MALSNGILRHRKHGNDANGTDDASATTSKKKDLQRSASWHEKATTHVLSHRRYALLAGIVLGVASMFVSARVFYSDQQFDDLLPIPSATMKLLGEKLGNMDWSKRMRDELFEYRPSLLQSFESSIETRPGLELARDENITAYSPVVLIPGFTSTGLEIWNGSACSKSYFRQRMWGTARMLQQFMMNQQCWLEHVMLNRTTGLDPDGIKLRPANGLEAADYVIGGFWVWGKLIENFADIGYDSNSMFMAAYDWRLAPHLMEQRDRYFTKLKFTIEMAKQTNGNRKVVLVSHSYATQVVYYFLKWVESDHGGKAGRKWVDEHIEAEVSIAGSILGTVKSISALMSGEMKDTAELGGLSKFLGYFFGPPARAALARSWPSVYAMLPLGGDAIWGTHDGAADDIASSFAVPPVSSAGTSEIDSEDASASLEVKEAKEASEAVSDAVSKATGKAKEDIDADADRSALLADHLAQHGTNSYVLKFAADTVNASWQHPRVPSTNVTARTIHALLSDVDSNLAGFSDWFATDVARDNDLGHKKYDAPSFWLNPLTSALPLAPNLKVFCFYGIGKPVERGYVYTTNPESEASEASDEQTAKEVSGEDAHTPSKTHDNDDKQRRRRTVPFVLDTQYNDLPWIKAGIRYSDGDGTVPLVSLGYMCARGWRNNRKFNPSGVDVRIREYKHNPVSMLFDPRGGPATSDHVDIMGNHELIKDVLRVAGRAYDAVPEHIESNIHAIADRINLDG